MQDYLDAKHPTLCADSDDENSNDSGSNDGYHVEKTNSNYNRAEEEFNTFESFKCNKYRPKWARVNSEIISGIGHNGNMQEIIVGPVEENGKDLPSGKNLGDYMNEKGNGYSVLLAVCSAICPASFWSRSANLYGAEHFGE